MNEFDTSISTFQRGEKLQKETLHTELTAQSLVFAQHLCLSVIPTAASRRHLLWSDQKCDDTYQSFLLGSSSSQDGRVRHRE